MSQKWWTGIAIFLLILAFLFTGILAFESGYNRGWDIGHETGLLQGKVFTKPMPGIPWHEEPEEPDWERILINIFEEIGSANITIHIEDTEGRESDIHISWSK